MILSNKIKVMIVDDSALVRRVLSRELEKCPVIEIINTAPDPYVAREMITKNKPDVMLLDIEMPRMDGITFLRKIMQNFPIPTIIVSSLAQQSSQLALEALRCGAVDVVTKPCEAYSIEEVIPLLIEKIKTAVLVNVKKIQIQTSSSTAFAKITSFTATTNRILVIGSSTGGTVALERILPSLPKNAPGTLVVQHIPAGFSRTFAERLNTICDVTVKEAKDGDSVVTGQVLIAPGNYHMWLKRDGGRYEVKIGNGEPLHYQRPCVEHLFNSTAEQAGKSAVGVILTGMGGDGAEGLLKMKKAGARTIAQDEASSVVWGMPGSAVKLNAAEFVLPLDKIVPKAMELLK
ncbi:MAG: chemotaxis response regulator protein-glutamate methylesterase [Chitinispirillales bacterium]|nr:chemotaxis response regulator protein-glutamate methylesterase [Chitinispirillales bacterium]